MTTITPGVRPVNPCFSSGPCAKRPGWSPTALGDAALGRSHRAKIGKAKLKLAIDLTREVLGVPADYRIGITPASDTGAVEMALWTLLGARGVDVRRADARMHMALAVPYVHALAELLLDVGAQPHVGAE